MIVLPAASSRFQQGHARRPAVWQGSTSRARAHQAMLYVRSGQVRELCLRLELTSGHNPK